MQHFPTIQKIDSAILYGLELASSLAVPLLAFGLITSMANVLTNGAILSESIIMQRIWSITQCTAIDASLSGTIIRAFEYGKKKEYIQMSLYAFLSVLLLFTAAIVSNIESVQQTLNLTLEKAYIHVFVPVEALIWIRSLSVVLLIVAHALKYAGSENIKSTQLAPPQKEGQKSEQEESGQATDIQSVTIIEEDKQIKALPQHRKARTRRAGTRNYEQVKAYMAQHQEATVREVAKALSIGTTTANKWMRKSQEK